MQQSDQEPSADIYIGDSHIRLLGTAHVSRESVELVSDVITREKPDTVAVELCQSRYDAIRQKQQWQDTNIINVIKQKKVFLLLSNLILASFQRRIAQKLDIKPGEEMLKAIDAAGFVNAAIYLGDRDIRVTLSRTWRIMGFWNKLKILFQLLLSVGDMGEISEEEIEKMKRTDVLESLLSDVGKSLPVLRDVLIDERDQYLTQKIRTAPGRKIVAVVGAGHIPGIKQYWEHHIDIEPLETIPPPKKMFGFLKWILPF